MRALIPFCGTWFCSGGVLRDGRKVVVGVPEGCVSLGAWRFAWLCQGEAGFVRVTSGVGYWAVALESSGVRSPFHK